MMAETETLNLFQRINKIRSEVKAVEKNANVDGRYQAVTHDDVTRMLRPLMVKHGVVSFLSLVDSAMVDQETMWGKRKLMQLRARFDVTYINIDNPEERFTIAVEAHADDNGDKAPGKVASYAQKYADLKTFGIQTGEDDESRVPEEQLSQPTLTEDQIGEVWARATEYWGEDGAREHLRRLAKALQVQGDDFTQIESRRFNSVMKSLKNKYEKEREAA